MGLGRLIERFLESGEHKGIREKTKNLFVPPGHFYSPIVNVEEVRPLFAEKAASPRTLPGIDIDLDAMFALWKQFLPYLKEQPFTDEQNNALRYYFKNPAFSYGDGSILYSMLRHFQPKRLIEVGSGYSSACAMDTIERYLGNNVTVSFIEPYPELLINLLGEKALSRVTINASGVQKADMSMFTQLEAGDFLFIDSTHVMKTGSDVCHELFNVLPSLKPGVFVHFHDIFWPFEYGTDWILKENRSWNELYGLRAFLMYNNAFEIVFFNDYFVQHCRESIEEDYPTMLKNTGGSIWLRKRS